MSNKYMLDANGEGVRVDDLMEWARWFEKIGKGRRLARTRVGKNAEVSTVFLGIDHRFGEPGPPLIWETMVFGGVLDQETERYSVRADALAGHAMMIERVRQAGLLPNEVP